RFPYTTLFRSRTVVERDARNDDDGLSQRVVVGQAQVDPSRHSRWCDPSELLGCATRQHQRRTAGRQIDDAHVAPEHPLPQAGSERLGAGLLRGEALGIGCRTLVAPIRLLALHLSKHAVEKTVAESRDRPLDTLDVDDVVSEAENHKMSGAPAACDACAR